MKDHHVFFVKTTLDLDSTGLLINHNFFKLHDFNLQL